MNLFNPLLRFFHRSAQDREIDEELRSHIQHRADDLQQTGLSRREAERRARIEFGGYVRFKEESHAAMGGRFFETLMHDIRFGLRLLRKSPGFTIAAVSTLAFAIGANAVVFSMLNGFLLRPLNVPHPRSLFMIERGKGKSTVASYPDYLDLRDRNRSFDGVLAYGLSQVGLDTGGNASSAWIFLTSGNYFDVLDLHPYLGRFFHSSDEHGPNSAPYIVLSYDYWRDHFLSDRNVVGRVVRLNKYPYTILGVAPPEFRGTLLFFPATFWAPLVNQEQLGDITNLTSRTDHSIFLVGSVKAGVLPTQATADLNSVGTYLAKTYPKEDEDSTYTLAQPGLVGDYMGPPVRAFLTGLMLLSGLILLAACANLGSLFAARAADRSREIALRLALGSSRTRILRQLLTEAVMVSLIGGALGLSGSIMLLRGLNSWQPMPAYPLNMPVAPDAKVYIVALLLALVSGFLFGIVPVRQVLRANPYLIVKAGSTGIPGRRVTVRDVLLVVQIAVCAVLVTSSMVAVRGLLRGLHSNFGFQPQNTMLMTTDLSMAGYRGDRVPIMQRKILDAVKTIPGAKTVALANVVPLGPEGAWNSSYIFNDSTTDLKASTSAAESIIYNISPEYFQAAGTTLIAGRAFTWSDDSKSPRVAIVNGQFARKVFGSADNSLNRYFKLPDGTRIQVIGQVEEGKYVSLTEDPRPVAFVPFLQAPSISTQILVRSNRDPQQLAADLERTIHSLDAGLPHTIETWNRHLDYALFASRTATLSLGVLGALGAMLAVTGVFGMASYSVSRRLRELGIRIALGAQRSEVLWAALSRALRLMAIGSCAGFALGIAASRVLSNIVYQATPRDPLVLASVVLAMLLLGLVATWIPATRALHADPLILLREE